MHLQYFIRFIKTTPSNKLINKKNSIIYEDENCQVVYNFWRDGGDIGFIFYNKTNEDIYLNLDKSFFILNGIAHDYYKNRVFTTSTSSGTSVATNSVYRSSYWGLIRASSVQSANSKGLAASSGFSISHNEEKIVCIPSKASKTIGEYIINKTLYRDCDLFKYPKTKQIKTKSFSKEESPFIFSNRIAYTVGSSNDLIKFENEFYITEISNYPERAITGLIKEEICGQKTDAKNKYFKYSSPSSFYIKYRREKDLLKH